MPRPQVIITPEATPQALAEAVLELQRLLTKGLGLGDAAAGSTLARNTLVGTTRPLTQLGLPDNMLGSLVEVTLLAADLGRNVKCDHNLVLPTPAARVSATIGSAQLLNVRWIVAGIRYLSANYAADLPVATDHRVLTLYANGAVGENTIELRFYTDLTLGGGQSLVVTLFFFPASA